MRKLKKYSGRSTKLTKSTFRKDGDGMMIGGDDGGVQMMIMVVTR